MTQQQNIGALIDELNQAVEAFTPAAKDVPGSGGSVPHARYRDRLITYDELRQELRDLGYTGLQLARLLRTAELDRDRTFRADVRALVLQAFQKGIIHEPLLRADLLRLGITSRELEEEIELATLRDAVRSGTAVSPPAAVPLA